ncbi:hypothetical protein MJO28_000143 [Puccinia striiformis f. sp. tritici]|uniref:Mob1/phocein n=4 Tax=Puccinia striiformis TaxID=27350 RepID=A0A0L0VMR1_9BASI|nr:hypothetical protein Pst134EA_001071 [Puccinia striiformis f. sp. tritici]KAI9624973.1 hypothetical protein H4Q26_016540 [Puccinia striiformis f. sp. tritici PST-130]KNF00320.1 hypothetical protein PSTG_06493 [Puccinia striiformis f. sp. tritici PST-78]POV97673.1 hypothetical protein PSTT_14912 [Puccinia striiformis]KAH9467285.1 hypothetical protein Pst134EB_002307 [Puccinia striiformis f. sp. tritici]KAH9474018.1 hypothetical protein Pst134EA_001071 [Puccinia striiformis f. sp. tritici]
MTSQLEPIYLNSPTKPTTTTTTTTTTTAKERPIRLRRGTRYEDAYPSMFAGLTDSDQPDPSSLLASLESPFQLQEYIAHLVRADPHAINRIIKLPTPLVQREVWIYEQLRRLAHDLGHPLVSALQADCNRSKCPEMKAGEWLYLCAAHATANENECCAIDYIVHTLDGATALLNSARYFPSRLQIPASSIKHFTSIARRLYRILAHAWFHHRQLFEECEMETSLYARFLALTDEFGLIAEDLLVIPRVTENEETEDHHHQEHQEHEGEDEEDDDEEEEEDEDQDNDEQGNHSHQLEREQLHTEEDHGTGVEIDSNSRENVDQNLSSDTSSNETTITENTVTGDQIDHTNVHSDPNVDNQA